MKDFYFKTLEFEARCLKGCLYESSTGPLERSACILREESMVAKNLGVILLEMIDSSGINKNC